MRGDALRFVRRGKPIENARALMPCVERGRQRRRARRVGHLHRRDRHALGGNPDMHTAMGVGYGVERLAMLWYDIDDIRKVDVAHVA
jgi:hypothetical protein